MKYLFAMVALFVTLNSHAAGEATEISASSARIVLSGWVGGRWGLFVTGREFGNVDGNFELLDRSQRVVATIPVHLNIHVWGLTNLIGMVFNKVITIENFKGKSVREILGDYSGISFGLAVPVGLAAGSPLVGLGARVWSTGNKAHVKLVDIAGILEPAVGFDLMKVRVRIDSNEYDVNHATKDALVGYDTKVVAE